MWPGALGEPEDVEATTTTSGMSHRLISPSALSSVRFATSGVTMLYGSLAPVQVHWMSGSKASGGARSVHCGTPFPMSSCTWHKSTGPESPLAPLPSAPPPPGRLGEPQATRAQTTVHRTVLSTGAAQDAHPTSVNEKPRNMPPVERSSVHIAVLVVAEDPATVDLAAATFLSDRVASAGHRVVAQEIVEASEAAIRDQLSRWIGQGHIDAIMSVGATEPAVAALIPLVTAPLQGLTDQLRLLARDRGGEGKPAAARCSKKFVFLLPAEVPALGPVLNQLVLPQLDSTQQRNLVSDMPRHNAIPQSLPSEKTASGAGLVPKLPARDKRKTGANVIARAAKIDDPTKPIELDSLERKLAQEEQAARFPSHDAPTRPHIDIASMLPAVPPGADETAETPAVPADPRRPATWDDVATPPPLTVQPSRLRSGPVGVAVGNNDKTVVRPTPTNDDKTAIRPAPTRPTLRNDDKTAIRPAPTRPEPTSAGRSDDKTAVRAAPTRPASQTSRGVQPTPTIGSPMVRPATPGAIGVAKGVVPSAVPSVKPALPSVVPSVPSVVPVIPKQPAAAAPESTKEQTTPGVMSPLAKPRAMPASGPTSTPTSGPTSTAARSEERRVGKECRSRWSPYH